MIIIYAVTCGEYSDYHIVGIFDSEHKAEADALAAHVGGGIEEYTTNEHADLLNAGLFPYHAWMALDDSGHQTRASREDRYPEPKECEPTLFLDYYKREMMSMWVVAHDETHALKIMSEKRAELIATGAVDAWRAAGRP